MLNDLLDQPHKFADYFRIKPETFHYILTGIEGALKNLPIILI